jgi:hypothetical protein
MQMEAHMGRKKDEPIPGDLSEEELAGELDEGLEESFPASDPPAATQPVHKPHDEKRDC